MAKCVKLVVGCSLLVEVSVHGGMLTMAGSWWEKNVITPNINVTSTFYWSHYSENMDVSLI
jgi:hypothetical protein